MSEKTIEQIRNELAAGKHRWTMCIPPQKDDSDMALQAPLDDVEHLISEIEKLKAELKQVIEIGVEGQREINRKAHAEITKLTRQRDIMKKCAEFYADGNNWSTINHMASVVTYDRLEYDKDLGDGAFQINEETNDKDVSGMRARKALQEAEGME